MVKDTIYPKLKHPKNIFDLLYMLDRDTVKTHRSHTKKIKQECQKLKVLQIIDQPILLEVHPPKCDSKNLKYVIYNACTLYPIDKHTTDVLVFKIGLRCKAKRTSRVMVTCYTKEELQNYLDCGYKIIDCVVDNLPEIRPNRRFSAATRSIFAAYVWEYLKVELEKFKEQVRGYYDVKPITKYEGARVTPFLSKFTKDGKRLTRAAVRSEIKKCTKRFDTDKSTKTKPKHRITKKGVK